MKKARPPGQNTNEKLHTPLIHIRDAHQPNNTIFYRTYVTTKINNKQRDSNKSNKPAKYRPNKNGVMCKRLPTASHHTTTHDIPTTAHVQYEYIRTTDNDVKRKQIRARDNTAAC
jgi:hypothetical protein